MTALEIAISQLGNHEQPKGSNTGPQVNEYLKSVGLKPGYAWCAAFVYWCAKWSNPETPLFKTGGVLNMWNKTDKKYRITKPQAGDIFVMDFGKGLGHMGFVESVGKTTITTIEGNTDSNSGREGWEVARRTRKISSINKGFLRIP